jgi:hypothetical protein
MIGRMDFATRGAACAVMMVLTTATSLAQQARNDGAALYEACNVVASAPEDLSNVKQLELTKAMFCVGYLHASHAALLKIHEHYKSLLQNYGHWKDETFVKGWFASQLLLAPDVCFPKNVRPKTLAMIISKYGKEHPETLTQDMYLFVGYAFQSAYPPTRSETCTAEK